ncbi:hypothetical protein BSLA_01f5444 [Burkholderia stabilis]|nr:hypothetical protein BSLA_01f5444 [Burkholderia stabilis]
MNAFAPPGAVDSEKMRLRRAGQAVRPALVAATQRAVL